MPEQSGAIAEIMAHITDLTTRLQAVESALRVGPAWAQARPAPQPAPLPAASPAAGVVITRPGNGTFEDLFLRDVGLSHPELRERTARLLQAQSVQLSEEDHAALLRILEPYLKPGHSSAPAARWTRTKLRVWIEAARSAGPARGRKARS